MTPHLSDALGCSQDVDTKLKSRVTLASRLLISALGDTSLLTEAPCLTPGLRASLSSQLAASPGVTHPVTIVTCHAILPSACFLFTQSLVIASRVF